MFQLVANLDIRVFALANGIFDIPFEDFDLHLVRELVSTHVDNQVELGDTHLVEIFRKLIVDIDVFGFHDFFGQWLHDTGGRKAGARWFKYIGAVFSREPFRHLAAARVADAQEQYFLHPSSSLAEAALL